MSAGPKCSTSSLSQSPMGFVRNEKGCLVVDIVVKGWLAVVVGAGRNYFTTTRLILQSRLPWRFCYPLNAKPLRSVKRPQTKVPSCETCNACMGVGWYRWVDMMPARGHKPLGNECNQGGSAPMHVSRPHAIPSNTTTDQLTSPSLNHTG